MSSCRKKNRLVSFRLSISIGSLNEIVDMNRPQVCYSEEPTFQKIQTKESIWPPSYYFSGKNETIQIQWISWIGGSNQVHPNNGWIGFSWIVHMNPVQVAPLVGKRTSDAKFANLLQIATKPVGFKMNYANGCWPLCHR